MYKRKVVNTAVDEDVRQDDVVVTEKHNDSLDVGKLLKSTIEENQTRKILEMLNECNSLSEAKKRIKAMLEPLPSPAPAFEQPRYVQNRNKETDTPVAKVKTMRIDDACQRYSIGRSSMRKLADDADAVIHVGRIYLIDIDKVDAYLDQLT